MIPLKFDKQQFPLATRCLEELGRQMPFLLKAAYEDQIGKMEERVPMLEEILGRVTQFDKDDPNFSGMVRAYALLSLEFLKLQRQLEKDGRYLYATERETYAKVYNSEVFSKYYLEGLLLSQALWPNHFKMAQRFLESFVSRLKSGDRLLEVGVGTGFHLSQLLQNCPGLNYLGLDLADTAIAFAGRYANISGHPESSVDFKKGSVAATLPFKDATFDHLIMGEVLEHIEDPLAALRELRRVVKPGGSFFMTTVIFAANIDHIYLFRDADEIRKMCQASGWKIELEWIYPLYAKDGPEMRDRPMNTAHLLR